MADESHATAMAHLQARRLTEAERVYRAILLRNPQDAEAMLHLGIIASMGGQQQAAIELLSRACALRPDNPAFLMNLGRACDLAGQTPQALAAYRRVTEIQPQFADAHERVGTLLLKDKKPAEAALFLQRLVLLVPGRPSAHNLLGTALSQQGKYQEALSFFDQALRLQPGFAEAHYNRGVACNEMGRIDEAFVSFDRAVDLFPDLAHKLKAALFIPEIMQSVDVIGRTRQRIHGHLARLQSGHFTIPDPEETLDASPFFLAYHGENDRDMQEMLARLIAKADPSLNYVAAHCGRPRTAGAPLRIGFLSRHFYNHTIGRLNAGLIRQLSRQLFQVVLFRFPGHESERLAEFIRQGADLTVTLAKDLPTARRQIAEQELDVLYYPAVGMDRRTDLLAFSRLARVQCVSWGHPVTTGIPNMDYFLSSRDLEPDLQASGARGGREGEKGRGGEREPNESLPLNLSPPLPLSPSPPALLSPSSSSSPAYTERLVTMEALTCYYYRPALLPPVRTRDYFGLAADHTLYVCPQTLFKIHPEFDAILAGILRADPRGRIVFIEGMEPHWNRLLTQRFERNLPDVAARIQFVRSQTPETFLHLLAACDVMLDPIHFGGGNTSFEGFAVGIPIVTLAGRFLRSRLTYAMYRKMGLDEAIATSPADYVQRAVRLGTDADFRQAMRGKILERSGVLYENAAAVSELERFLAAAVGNKATG